MFKNIDLFTRRYWQITIALMFFVFIQRYFHIPHDEWIIITSGMIYIGFDPGIVLKRAYLRFYGTIAGVAAVSISWYFIHLDYRLATIFLVLLAPFATFIAKLPYNYYVIVITIFSDTLIQIFNPIDFHPEFYAFDRILCTLIVFAICIFIEYVWFGRSDMTLLNYNSLCNSLKLDVKEFYRLTYQNKVCRGKIFKMIKQINFKIDRLNTLVEETKNEGNHRYKFTQEEKIFGHNIIQAFRKSVSIYYLQFEHNQQNLILQQLRTDAERLINSL